MKLGFVGTGAIAEAIILGLFDSGMPDLSIIVSPRNETVAARLAGRFPTRVTVAADNQAVLDRSEVVVLSVRPQILREVLFPLSFDPMHVILSLVAMTPIRDIADMVAPAERVIRAIPLPSAARLASPTPIMPPDPLVKELFDRIGVAIEVADEPAFDALAAASGIMAGHFAFAGTVAEWLLAKGVPEAEARDYVGRIFSGLALTAERTPDTSFGRLSDEHTTLWRTQRTVSFKARGGRRSRRDRTRLGRTSPPHSREGTTAGSGQRVNGPCR